MRKGSPSAKSRVKARLALLAVSMSHPQPKCSTCARSLCLDSEGNVCDAVVKNKGRFNESAEGGKRRDEPGKENLELKNCIALVVI